MDDQHTTVSPGLGDEIVGAGTDRRQRRVVKAERVLRTACCLSSTKKRSTSAPNTPVPKFGPPITDR